MPVALSTQNIQTFRRGLRNLFGLPAGLFPREGGGIAADFPFPKSVSHAATRYSSAKGSASSLSSSDGGALRPAPRAAGALLLAGAAACVLREGVSTSGWLISSSLPSASPRRSNP